MLNLLRWLLVPLFPILGFLLGVWLMPEGKPRWETLFHDNRAVKGLGFVNDGQTLLLMETRVEENRRFISNNALGVVGLKASTGEELFRTPLSDELLQGEGVQHQHLNLTTDGQGILFSRRVRTDPPQNSYDEILVYDWKTRKICKRYRSPYINGAINWPLLRGNTLAAMGGAGEMRNLLLWTSENETPTVLPLAPALFDVGISQDGAMIHACVAYGQTPKLIIIDAQQQKVLQTIESQVREVRWADDHQSFLAVEYNPERQRHVARRYELVNQQFQPIRNSEVDMASIGNVSTNKPHLTFATSSQTDPWRTKIVKWTGDSCKLILDRLWPVGRTLQLHDNHTGRLREQLVLPDNESGLPFVHPDARTVALCHWGRVACWEFSPATRWYSLYGFLAGTMLAVILAW